MLSWWSIILILWKRARMCETRDYKRFTGVPFAKLKSLFREQTLKNFKMTTILLKRWKKV